MTEYNRHLVPALPLLFVISVRGVDAAIQERPRALWPARAGCIALAAWLLLGAPALGMSIEPRRNVFMLDLGRNVADPRRFAGNFLDFLASRPRTQMRDELYGSDAITENGAYMLG